MAQCIRALAAKPNNLHLIPRTHVEKGKNRLSQIVPSPVHLNYGTVVDTINKYI